MSFSECLEWCESQGDSSIDRVIAILKDHPDATSDQLQTVFWNAATNQTVLCREDIPQDEESGIEFYRALPVLPVLRPLMACHLCEMPTLNVWHHIAHLSASHNLRANAIAEELQRIFRRTVEQSKPDASTPPHEANPS